MITRQKFVLSVLLATIMLMSMAFVPVSAQEEVIEQELNFGPGTFEELKNSPDILAAYGKMPSFENTDQRREWFDILVDIGIEVRDNPQYNISDYIYPNGPVVSYGANINGCLVVTVEREVDKPLMDYIYWMFDQQAQTKNIKEVPLVFEKGEVPREDLIPEANTSEIENNRNQQTGTNQQTNEEKTNNIPGFSLIYGLFGLYLVSRIRR
ncbi:MAG: hypothetical protein QM426_09205 [Euryarchaeota archaeon]|nr:hypothetical protein [Euryarchaeota archaeon]